VFLNMGLSEVGTHVQHANRLLELMHRQQARDDDGD
jgi:hypothetical protein